MNIAFRKAELSDAELKKCGFDIQSMETDGNVKVARFVLER